MSRNTEKAEAAVRSGDAARAARSWALVAAAREDEQRWARVVAEHEGARVVEEAEAVVAAAAAEPPSHPLESQPTEPLDFKFRRNTQSLTTNQAADHNFGQKHEPAGRYMTEDPGLGIPPPPGWIEGTVHFDQPLHLDFGGGYTEADNWKQRLSAHYGDKKGRALSQALRNDGWDAIITHTKYGISEVVDLTMYEPKGTKKR